MPRAKVFHLESYDAALREFASDKLIDKLESREEQLAAFPDMGSPLVRPSISERYGANLRQLIVDGYVVVYEHDGDSVFMHTLIPARMNV